MEREHLEFITGRLAEPALRSLLAQLSPELGWDYSVTVLPISVAALMTPKWICRQWKPDPRRSRVILPGYCDGDMSELQNLAGVPIERGPRDLRQLPNFFGRATPDRSDYGGHSIEIIAEINHAPRRKLPELLADARRLVRDGADIVDVGCDPGDPWSGVADCVRALRSEGIRVSIDSLQPVEIAAAAKAGAELVLSVNGTNVHAAADWGCEVVVIPDNIGTLEGLETTLERLEQHQIRYRIDPVLEPIGCGMAASLGRYLEARSRWPTARMMMGIGNITELTDADSGAINLVLLGLCEEMRIESVLTTQVIPWARASVRECAIARQLVHYAVRHRIPPKHIDPSLVMLRDGTIDSYPDDVFDAMAQSIRDSNYRIYAERGELHLLSSKLHLRDSDPFRLFDQLMGTQPKNVDASHAFYLGFEMAKAMVALTLGKNYRQDEALDWGYLTVAEPHHRLARRRGPTTGAGSGSGEET
ncbi:MAG: hypothetical protein RIS70_1867 [Planctomycetota bacterium]